MNFMIPINSTMPGQGSTIDSCNLAITSHGLKSGGHSDDPAMHKMKHPSQSRHLMAVSAPLYVIIRTFCFQVPQYWIPIVICQFSLFTGALHSGFIQAGPSDAVSAGLLLTDRTAQ